MIYAFANSKGGVGKSTLAVHLVLWLLEKTPSVALIDADVLGSSSPWLHEAAPQAALFRWNTADDLLEGIPNVRSRFEHVVIDGPAGLSEVTRTILFVADRAFLPLCPSVLDLRAMAETVRIVRRIQTLRQGPPSAMLIPNKLQLRTRLARELLETAKTFELPTASGLRLRQAYADAAGQGKAAWSMGASAADAALEIRTLLEEMTFHEGSTNEATDEHGHATH